VKVPLPEGWVAHIAGDQSFRAGPPGRAVLRIDLRPGGGASLPGGASLEGLLTAELKGVKASRIELREEDNLAILLYKLSLTRDSGPPAEVLAMAGAKRIGRDLFLCSSVPGASEAEVKQAAEACHQISVPPV
jgi:hypothetical protein